MKKLRTPFNVTVEKLKQVDLIPENKRTWEENMIYNFNHSEVVDEKYFKSHSGEKFNIGDTKVLCFLKQDEKKYLHCCIKESEIGTLYEIIQDELNNRSGKIIVIKNK
jgi:hypothetical protein